MKKAALHNLGCKVNAYETESMQQKLEADGYEIVPFGEKADVYIINTCTVTNMADRKSRQMIHKAKKMNPDAIVVATGCYVQASEEDCRLDDSIDIIIGNNKKTELVTILREYQEHGTDLNTVIDINHTKEYEDMPISRVENHTRAYIKIQDGCNQFCTYCIIPFARGRVRSRAVISILEEVTTLAAGGYKEIVLTGIHLSSYGIDFIEKSENLLTLIVKIHEIKGIERIRLGSLEPRIITEEFVTTISKLYKVCPHFHLSLQSGSDSILKKMNRRYSTSEYYDKCDLLRKHYVNPGITTDIIVGFPGETEDEFYSTKEYAKRIGFSEMHIFKYSKRDGTKAAIMPEQVSEEIKTIRSNELIEIGKELSEQFRHNLAGESKDVLIEENIIIDGESYAIGYTKEYVKVAITADYLQSGDIVQVILGDTQINKMVIGTMKKGQKK
ncbi:MAG: tRNA (N(6)-L-threonylcarbamoyladenosine(37)-C(2))-methylthiotransferase MtaB [Clostridiales bacterium]|nr:tRNA (N(6)-L-threonylcarbamoyladenosine(37)-C(2))-methylthiotransferase MtaB [Clostridiales bacterium]